LHGQAALNLEMGVEAGAGAFQSVRRDVCADHLDMPALERPRELLQAEQDGIGFLAGRGRGAPDP
jgi:hypothetical protein